MERNQLLESGTVTYAERPLMKGIIFLMVNIYPRISLISTFFRENATPQKFRQEKWYLYAAKRDGRGFAYDVC